MVPDKTASSGENISDVGSDSTAYASPTEKTRKLSTEEVQQEEKERGIFQTKYTNTIIFILPEYPENVFRFTLLKYANHR